MQWCVVACFWRVAPACTCSPPCFCLGNSWWLDGVLVQCNMGALPALFQPSSTEQRVCVCVSQSACCAGRSPATLTATCIQPVCMPVFQKAKRPSLLVRKRKRRSESQHNFISSRQHRYLSARVNPPSPPHPISSQPMGSQSPLSPGESQPAAHTHTHTAEHTHITELQIIV